MQPLGNKILVRDIIEEKKTESGIVDLTQDALKKVKIVQVSPDSATYLKPDDICLSERGGVEIEKGLWLCQESMLVVRL